MPRSEGSGIRGVIRVAMVVLALWARPAGAQERIGSTADGKSGVSGDGAVSTESVAASKFASTTCVDGSAAGHSCSGIDLVSFVPRPDLGAASNIRLNDIWGWT
ncbi:MAG: hypothetical protein HKN17_00890, partial [Rhodothermales bacterium]|nr:hypothetical protein [Rhodothermales bacterium]